MGNVSRDLDYADFACKCGCGLNNLHPFTAVGIQKTADLGRLANKGADVIVNVLSGCRCFPHNAQGNVGGGTKSQHLPHYPTGICKAADVEFIGLTLQQAYFAAMAWERFYNGGVGLYIPDESGKGGPVRLHLDVRDGKARWGYIGGVKVDSMDKVLATALERGL